MVIGLWHDVNRKRTVRFGVGKRWHEDGGKLQNLLLPRIRPRPTLTRIGHEQRASDYIRGFG